MPPTIDPAIIRALSLDPATATIKSHGGSGFASTFRIIAPTTSIFVKVSSNSGAAQMFEGEHASLSAIHDAVPSLCPKSFGWGRLENQNGHFLATEFLDMGSGWSSRTKGDGESGMGSGMTLAQKLAKLHTTPAPVPEGYGAPQFGFPVATCCGSTPQQNEFMSSWADFFANHRLLHILSKCEKSNGSDPELRKIVQRTVDEIVPVLLRDGHLGGKEGIIPVVVHGDLWSGNKGKAKFVGRNQENPEQLGPAEDVVFDPSAAYAHNEYDFGIMNMFGGFGASFWKEYHSIVPKTKPEEEYEARISLYESYHHLNHYALFGYA